ncbi:preprotein translocase subunit SecA [Blochmannia endosymbiont of Polyrhachis (Hedomyrma) turneri]|uniref:preprotein translocase subunit SecA n=1 Tax=Blochmannia endosymbiont of Polyrhachis (Hedomyrma) turneri TaxID=1505596 RepID=UPI00061A7480|nr:preprotein translocase subunit SecA [Blochmannia endosymbiont of Polyrhachis (Hedomyrma) turneri]AKC59731.1 Protein translocase subunit SecA [Blochmannia endosymbiont of Polyrhachis (Hedomyrma) turneri]
MLLRFFSKFFGSYNNRILRRVSKIVEIINRMESDMERLTDKQLSAKTDEFRSCIRQGQTLEYILPQAFAVVREASKRIFNMRHFDVQLLGGIVLNNRCVAEMRTGEGKTLTATLPAYLNALTGKGVHIVTVNNYLAERDANDNRPLFEFLGLTVGLNLPGMSISDKRLAYQADITYGTNNEYGFDYLRDNMIFDSQERVQRVLHYALLDEVDSILIDEARTPLIISGPAEDSSDLYKKINMLIPSLVRQDREDSDSFQGKGHFVVDEKFKQVILTERGLILIEKLMMQAGIMNEGESLYSPANIILMHHMNAALRAHVLFTREVDYIVKDGEVLIVDEHTGRVLPGRRWSDGLHQAIEAKENLSVQSENHTLASITFQNYFRLYEKLSGMTGTAATESFEFRAIYKLDTIVIPTNCPMIRKDFPDLVYMTECEKIVSIINDIKSCVRRNQPVLVGTISIEKSEVISCFLKREHIPHKVLNAKFHAVEADIIAQAGRPGAVTIATNMAGRGTDIVLGGNWRAEIAALGNNISDNQITSIKSSWKKRNDAVLSAGGLHIIGTERHESRRIDNQLRGRSGRQGDVGSSRFYLSMEDSLMRIFASERVVSMMRKLGMQSGDAIEHPWVTKTIANAQRRVENRNFDIRKELLEYDDVANDQRRVVYTQRNILVDMLDVSDVIKSMRGDVVKKVCDIYIPISLPKRSWDICGLEKCLHDDFSVDVLITQWLHDEPSLYNNGVVLHERVLLKIIDHFLYQESLFGVEVMRSFEKSIILQTFDLLWKEHLSAMEYLRQGIHLRGYAQKDPKQEYKRESFLMFSKMLEDLKYEVVISISKLHVLYADRLNCSVNKDFSWYYSNIFTDLKIGHINNDQVKNNILYKVKKNDLCPCQSGKTFRLCHGYNLY